MAKAQNPQMLTANRLKDGDVLYWKAGHWVLALKDGDVFDDPAQADMALAEAQKYVTGNAVVNPYLFDVRMDGIGIHPAKEREIIRAAGPTVRGEGKQADDPAAHHAEQRVQRSTQVEAKEDDVSI